MDATQELTEDIITPASLALKARNFYVILIIIQAFLVFNGEYIWGISERAATLYFFMPSALMFGMLGLTELEGGKRLTWDSVNNSLLAKRDFLSAYLKEAGWSAGYFSLGVQLIYFSVAAGLAALAFMILIMQGYINPQITPPMMMQAAWITQAFLVIPSEEMMFRGIVPEYIRLMFGKSKYSEQLKYLIGAGIFGIMHFAAYGGSWGSIGFAFGLGLVLQYVKDNAGLPASMGLHLAWNAAVLGLLIPVVGA
ncbi:MAG: CPBP family intramembrane metalloprotease [Bacteroidales bacterium]|nr:CPBP family intramembrane metalloprotease [Bacteroidales bacterium]